MMASRTDIATHNYNTVMLEFPLYIHTQQVTSSVDHGVECIEVRLIISRSTRQGAWSLESVDAGDLLLYVPHAAKSLIAEGAMQELYNRGFDPGHIRGWGKWFKESKNGRTISSLLEKYASGWNS